jgi:CheY-like chemotaxis protein
VIGLRPTEDKRRILVVDDLEENRLLLVELLEKIGFVTQQGLNGEDAILLNEHWKPDLIIIDMRMPVMNGFESIQKIRSSACGNDIPIIAVTASAFNEDHKLALNAGADAFLRKPYKEQELFAAIKTCLGIEYIYRENDTEKKPAQSEESDMISAESISKLPSSLVAQIQHAAASANLDQLLVLIDKTSPHSSQAAKILRGLAQSYQYEKILALFEDSKHKTPRI